MATLFLHDRSITSIFQLLGESESDVTCSLGWALSRSPAFLRYFLKMSLDFSEHFSVDEVIIRLQEYEGKHCITDIEIELPNTFFLIIEAKRGWNLPTTTQLKRYIKRRAFRYSTARLRKLLVLSECSKAYYDAHLRINSIGGVSVLKLSWRAIYQCSNRAMARGRHAEKRLLLELAEYLERIMTMQQVDSNWVFVGVAFLFHA